jgi:hypothetical protein
MRKLAASFQIDTTATEVENIYEIEEEFLAYQEAVVMRKLLVLAVILFSFSLTAAANDLEVSANPVEPPSAPAAPAPSRHSDYPTWQLGMGFQYQHYQINGASFPTYGYNTDVTRSLNSWGSLEGIGSFGFGHLGGKLNPATRSLFVGGGPRVTIRNDTRIEPYMHVLVGLEHFRFTETSGSGSQQALAFLGGIGADFKFRPRLYLRIEGDYLGTHYNSAAQSNYSASTGFVFNF